MKEAVTKVIDTLTQEDFQKLLERYNKCIAARGDYFEGDRVSCVLSIKSAHMKKKKKQKKKTENLFNDPRTPTQRMETSNGP